MFSEQLLTKLSENLKYLAKVARIFFAARHTKVFLKH